MKAQLHKAHATCDYRAVTTGTKCGYRSRQHRVKILDAVYLRYRNMHVFVLHHETEGTNRQACLIRLTGEGLSHG